MRSTGNRYAANGTAKSVNYREATATRLPSVALLNLAERNVPNSSDKLLFVELGGQTTN